MSGEKIYEGRQYKFKKKKKIGSGGNGAVYDVELLEPEVDFPVVAKFFDYNFYHQKGKKEEALKRYERFKREIQIVKDELSDIDGIMQILDYSCPNQMPSDSCKAWYLMKKAEKFQLNKDRTLFENLSDMLQLANTISALHKKKNGYAHRDIKPENLLILDDRIMLSDFGLIWSVDQERITEKEDRLGPYKILPPELEENTDKENIDFRCSDVYLFAKVLWMVLKKDNYGFRGQYNRKDKTIYITPESLSASTLEPIHYLLEKATVNSLYDRITIDECIKLIDSQIKIIDGSIPEETVNYLKFNEIRDFFCNRYEPGSVIYDRKEDIYRLIGLIISASIIYIRGPEGRLEKIMLSKEASFKSNNDGSCVISFWISGKKIREYFFKIHSLRVVTDKNSTNNGLIFAELEKIDIKDKNIISISKSRAGYKEMASKIYISEDYDMIFSNRDLGNNPMQI